MCGIAGEIAAPGRTPDLDALARMGRVLAPRGPDGEGMWADGGVALDQTGFPDAMGERVYYHPVERGLSSS